MLTLIMQGRIYLRVGKQMAYEPTSLSLQGWVGCLLHRPTLGWTVREDILLCKVSWFHPPSSLGLDGGGERLSCYDDSLGVHRETSSPCVLIGVWGIVSTVRYLCLYRYRKTRTNYKYARQYYLHATSSNM